MLRAILSINSITAKDKTIGSQRLNIQVNIKLASTDPFNQNFKPLKKEMKWTRKYIPCSWIGRIHIGKKLIAKCYSLIQSLLKSS